VHEIDQVREEKIKSGGILPMPYPLVNPVRSTVDTMKATEISQFALQSK